MSRTRRWYEIAVALPIVAVFAAYYVYEVVTGPPRDFPAHYLGLAAGLAIPTALWLVASWLVVRHWWHGTGERLSTLDPPERLLAVAAGTLPEHRRAWGAAMSAELAGVHGRAARWRFALSSANAALRLQRTRGWLAVALTAGVAVAAGVAVVPAVRPVVPGLAVFSATFVGVLGAAAVLTFARSRRVRVPVPAATALVTVAVALSITVTVVFLLRYPDTLPPYWALTLAVGLAGCVWIAVATPPSLTDDRLAAHVGAGTALVCVLAGPLLNRIGTADAEAMAFNLLVFGPPLGVFFAAVLAGALGKTFRAGVHAGIWAAITFAPLGYAVGLAEAMRRFAIDGTLFDGEVAGGAGEILYESLTFSWVFGPVLAWPFAVLGAAIAALNARAS